MLKQKMEWVVNADCNEVSELFNYLLMINGLINWQSDCLIGLLIELLICSTRQSIWGLSVFIRPLDVKCWCCVFDEMQYSKQKNSCVKGFEDGKFLEVLFVAMEIENVKFEVAEFEVMAFEVAKFKEVPFEEVEFDEVTFEDVEFEEVNIVEV